MQPNCDVKRFDAIHFTQTQTLLSIFCIPSLLGGSGPQTPRPNTMPRSSTYFLPHFFTVNYRFCRLPSRFFNDTKYHFFSLLSFFYDITHIKYSKKDQRAFILPKNDNENEKRYRKINTAWHTQGPGGSITDIRSKIPL